MLNHFSLSRAWQRHSLSWSKCISHPICLHSRHTSQDQRLWSLSDEKSSQPYTSYMENKFQASKNKQTFCLSDLCLQTTKLWLTRPMLKNCLSLKATRRSTSATCNQATKAHDKILDQAIVTQASRTIRSKQVWQLWLLTVWEFHITLAGKDRIKFTKHKI